MFSTLLYLVTKKNLKNKKIICRDDKLDITLWDKAGTTFPEDDILEVDQHGPIIVVFLSTTIKKFNSDLFTHVLNFINKYLSFLKK